MSASSWGCELKWHYFWKRKSNHQSASSWGCELKYYEKDESGNQTLVSLFVRLWVEIRIQTQDRRCTVSASSWGCELKFLQLGAAISHLPSASSWGCELKCPVHPSYREVPRQPLREAVSWNIKGGFCDVLVVCQPLREAVSWNASRIGSVQNTIVSLFVRLWVEINHSTHREARITVSLFVRLWVEMPYGTTKCKWDTSQPLREAVSWNTPTFFWKTLRECQPLREAVSWNGKECVELGSDLGQPLREAVSWNLTCYL